MQTDVQSVCKLTDWTCVLNVGTLLFILLEEPDSSRS